MIKSKTKNQITDTQRVHLLFNHQVLVNVSHNEKLEFTKKQMSEYYLKNKTNSAILKKRTNEILNEWGDKTYTYENYKKVLANFKYTIKVYKMRYEMLKRANRLSIDLALIQERLDFNNELVGGRTREEFEKIQKHPEYAENKKKVDKIRLINDYIKRKRAIEDINELMFQSGKGWKKVKLPPAVSKVITNHINTRQGFLEEKSISGKKGRKWNDIEKETEAISNENLGFNVFGVNNIYKEIKWSSPVIQTLMSDGFRLTYNMKF